ncbi:MAG: hypothetical protein E7497_01960 [Ruminococcus sp.]|nr:hypothetical protein [Ruminococcus sp.]
MTYGQKQRKDESYYGTYACWMYRTHGKEYCPSHYINYDTVYNLVLINLSTRSSRVTSSNTVIQNR